MATALLIAHKAPRPRCPDRDAREERGWFGHCVVIHLVTGETYELGGSRDECYSEEQACHIVETLLEEIA